MARPNCGMAPHAAMAWSNKPRNKARRGHEPGLAETALRCRNKPATGLAGASGRARSRGTPRAATARTEPATRQRGRPYLRRTETGSDRPLGVRGKGPALCRNGSCQRPPGRCDATAARHNGTRRDSRRLIARPAASRHRECPRRNSVFSGRKEASQVWPGPETELGSRGGTLGASLRPLTLSVARLSRKVLSEYSALATGRLVAETARAGDPRPLRGNREAPEQPTLTRPERHKQALSGPSSARDSDPRPDPLAARRSRYPCARAGK